MNIGLCYYIYIYCILLTLPLKIRIIRKRKWKHCSTKVDGIGRWSSINLLISNWECKIYAVRVCEDARGNLSVPCFRWAGTVSNLFVRARFVVSIALTIGYFTEAVVEIIIVVLIIFLNVLYQITYIVRFLYCATYGATLLFNEVRMWHTFAIRARHIDSTKDQTTKI